VIATSGLVITHWINYDNITQEQPSLIEYVLVISSSNGGSTDPVQGVHEHFTGSNIVVSAISDAGYQFVYWDLDGEMYSANPIHILLEANHSLHAVFTEVPTTPEKHYLVTSTTLGGTMDPSPGTYEFDEGAMVTITAMPIQGYRFSHWRVNDDFRAVNPIAQMLDQDINLVAVFVINYDQYVPPTGSHIYGGVEDTELKENGSIILEGIGTFSFNPKKIASRRPDIFQPGHFSVFDVIAYLHDEGKIHAVFHFDETMNTYVIDSINGYENWWYMVYYDGGWTESNAFRMDHYPVKDKMFIQIFQALTSELDKIHESFRIQASRRQLNNKTVVAEVVISGLYEDYRFTNVTVEAHNLRDDVFKPGVITALDVILSLADQGEFSYDLKWYATILSSEVKDYYIERIGKDAAHGRCGFVYESGEKTLRSILSKNHIHLPADIRVINSPEYMELFWICI